jgi:hypothetical protein
MRCLVFVLLAIASCLPSTQETEGFETDAIVAEVREVLDSYYRDIKQKGLKAEFQYLDSSDNFFWVPPGYSSAILYDSVASILNANAAMFRSIDNAWDTLSVIPLSSDIATYTGRISSKATDTSGKKSTTMLIETGTLIKRKDGWKLLCGQTSVIK